jgi:hypothetical protein
MLTTNTVTSLAEVVKLAAQRQEALQPVDVTDELPMYVYQWRDGHEPAMTRLTSDRTLRLSPRAESQLLQRLGVPVPFFRKLPLGLKFGVVNHFTQSGAYDRAALLRTVKGDVVRAFLTDTYQPLDDADVLPILADVLGDDELRIEALDFAPDFTHLRVLFPREVVEPRRGDVLMTGLNITNSETGCRAVHVDQLVYRLVCTNGLVRAESAGRTVIRHVGRADRLKDQLHTAVRDAKLDARALAREFGAAIARQVSDPAAALKHFADDGQLTREQLHAALAAYTAEPDPTTYGLVNAVTRAAQVEPDYESRYQMERQGALLLARLG